MTLNSLYDSYASMEQLPISAREEGAAASKRRSELLAAIEQRAAIAKKTAEVKKTGLLSDLRTEAQAASALGAIPKPGTTGSGSEPNFARTRQSRQKLDSLIKEERQAAIDLDRLQADLRALEKQIEDEHRNKGLWAKARAADIVTYLIGGLTVLGSLASGPGRIGMAILVGGMTIVGFRFVKGKSARIMRAATTNPAVASHPKVRLGYVLVEIGWTSVVALILNLIATSALRAGGIDGPMGGVTRPTLDIAWFLAILVAGVIIAAGYKARGGRSER